MANEIKVSDKPRRGVVLVILSERLLLAGRLVRQPQCWKLPQGGIDHGETREAAAERELWEELGLQHEHLTEIGWITPQGVDQLFSTEYALPEGKLKIDNGVAYSRQEHIWKVLIAERNVVDLVALDKEENPEFSEVKFITVDELMWTAQPMQREVYAEMIWQLMSYLAERNLPQLRRDEARPYPFEQEPAQA